jgi:hypothetical protein
MGSTNNMDRVDKEPNSTEGWSESSAAADVGSASDANQSRRRLVRGAAALAPLVLTLRSGALAAASCTGAKAFGTLRKEGQNWRIDNATGPLADGDICVTSAAQCSTTPPKVAKGQGERNGTVMQQGANYRCDGGNNYRDGEPVAILSSASAISLYGAR